MHFHECQIESCCDSLDLCDASLQADLLFDKLCALTVMPGSKSLGCLQLSMEFCALKTHMSGLHTGQCNLAVDVALLLQANYKVPLACSDGGQASTPNQV